MLTLIKMLVCEGACNSDLGKVLDEVDSFRAKYNPAGGEDARMPRPPDEIVAELNALLHTPHLIGNSGIVAKCRECGTVRLYGVQ